MTKNDEIMQSLLKCDCDAKLILEKLNSLNLYACDFTLDEISRVLGITRERVRQIESAALKKIKHPKVGKKLQTYIEI